MSALFPKNDDTLTSRNIMDAYISAYYSVHNQKPVCETVDGRIFRVEGIVRDRRWMVLEVERLRQEALSAALNADNPNASTGKLFKLIRRLSRI